MAIRYIFAKKNQTEDTPKSSTMFSALIWSLLTLGIYLIIAIITNIDLFAILIVDIAIEMSLQTKLLARISSQDNLH